MARYSSGNYLRWFFGGEKALKSDSAFYAETQELMDDPWRLAFLNCQDDLDYVDQNQHDYDNRWFLPRVLLVAALTLLAATIFFGIALMFVGFEKVGIAILGGFIVLVLMWVWRLFYYRRVGFNLFLANERIDAYTRKWPSIITVVKKAKDGKIPPEPRDTACFDEADMQQFLAEVASRMMRVSENRGRPVVEPEPKDESKNEFFRGNTEEEEVECDLFEDEAAEEPEELEEEKSEELEDEAGADGMVEIEVGAEDDKDILKILTNLRPVPKAVPEPEPVAKPEPVAESVAELEPVAKPEPVAESTPKSEPEPEPTTDIDNFDEIITAAEKQIRESSDELRNLEMKLMILKILGP